MTSPLDRNILARVRAQPFFAVLLEHLDSLRELASGSHLNPLQKSYYKINVRFLGLESALLRYCTITFNVRI